MQKVIKSENLNKDLCDLLATVKYDKLFVLMDSNTEKLCFPNISMNEAIASAKKITIKSGDQNKNIASLTQIWEFLSNNGATRHSLMINLGGGMLTDIGGFAAATFKRGIKFINIPTTLLGAVDAAVGGKTGINFNGLKNEVGAFAPAEAVLIDSIFFKSLDRPNMLSGYAEMIKHGLIANDKIWRDTINYDTLNIDYNKLREMTVESVTVKEQIAEEDPFERGIRKALNLGHTIGHAFESLSYEIGKPIQHGYAVAWGIICELYLSQRLCQFPQDKLRETVYFIRDNYHGFLFDCKSYDLLYEYMKHDKKNESDIINFTLLSDVGQVIINQTASKDLIFESIDFLRDSVGL